MYGWDMKYTFSKFLSTMDQALFEKNEYLKNVEMCTPNMWVDTNHFATVCRNKF